MMLPTPFIFSHNFRILASYNPTILQICFFLVRSRKFVTFAIVKFIKT